MKMNGTNAWDSTEIGSQPQLLSTVSLPSVFNYKYIQGCIRWAKVKRGSNLYTGWVLCYPSGKPITYADASQPGSIKVSCSGTYMTT